MYYFFFTSALGWLATLLLAAQIVLPYLLRPSRLSRWLGVARQRGSTYLRRLLPHFWIGYLLLVLAAAHAWIPMQTGYMVRADSTGLWFASVAFLLLVLQTLLGRKLREQPLPSRSRIRGWHFWFMLALAFSVVAHVFLNA
jgi:hypothetical protein